jgi:hypothetical protein
LTKYDVVCNLNQIKMKKFHIAVAVKDITLSIEEYSIKLECRPEIVIDGKFALWRNDILNFSISHRPEIAGTIRHIGFENSEATESSETYDYNGVIWEEFPADIQMEEIEQIYGKIKQ